MFKGQIELNSFLSIVASDVFQYYNQRLSDVLFILPNRRSGSVFKEELIKQIDIPIWTPEIKSINDWIIDQCDFAQADEFECLINLYEALKMHWPKIGTFIDFLSWGDILLRDFDEIDKYLVSYEKLYKQLSDEKEIEERFSMLKTEELQLVSRFWKGLDENASQTQKDWLSLWNSLTLAAKEYIDRMKVNGMTSVSYMYRLVSEQIQKNDRQSFEKEICFIGFNALTKSEELIFDKVNQVGKGRFYWDASELIEDYPEKFPAPQSFILKLACEQNRLYRPETCDLPAIRLSSYESGLAQLKDIGPEQKSAESSAIVLGDENGLDELIWSLKVRPEDINISIGKSLFQTKLGQIISEQLTQIEENEGSTWEDSLLLLINELDNLPKNNPSYFEEKAIELFEEKVSLVKKLGKEYHSDLMNASFVWLMKKWLRSAKIPYPSNPKAKILITGILETRLLDFKNLSIVTMNEGVWPAKSRNTSFIPFHLRKEFKMPVPETVDGMYAYHFFRLIQRAENVHIAYVAQSDNMKSGVGEMSRFIRSLMHIYNLPLDIKQVIAPAKIRSSGYISIPKSEEVTQLLRKYLRSSDGEKMLSPSALNTYIDCSLRFFFQYLLNIKDEDEAVDLSESRLFGKLLHETMERFYTHVVKKKIVTKSEIQKVLDDDLIKTDLILPVLSENESESFGSVDFKNLSAKDNLVLDVIANYVKLILKTDLEYAPFSITGLELKVKSWYPVKIEGKDHEVLLGGYIDRLDLKGDVVRVIDYKSGSPTMKIQNISDLTNGAKSVRAKEVFQALFYCSLLKGEDGYKDKNLIPGLYAMRSIEGGLLQPYITKKKDLIESDDQYLEDTDQIISELLNEIFDPEIGFSTTSKKDNCKFCSFQAYCQKT